MKISDSLKDIKEDQEANKYGRNKGKKFKNESCSVLVDIYRPNGLNDRY